MVENGNDVAQSISFAEDLVRSRRESPMLLKWWRVEVAPGELGEHTVIGCRLFTYGRAPRMREARFVDVRERVYKWPGGHSGGQGNWGATVSNICRC